MSKNLVPQPKMVGNLAPPSLPPSLKLWRTMKKAKAADKDTLVNKGNPNEISTFSSSG